MSSIVGNLNVLISAPEERCVADAATRNRAPTQLTAGQGTMAHADWSRCASFRR
jgi:hypothetical protein